ncbi:hypothetical protein [Acidithiobacillus caldus]|uniref:Uncharacterized protein n=1 Tax=Acidithiobacillus caldus TaxID=33059 RepID=A0A1E7YNT2_9PROT|nr:hypothetical protein [Acidithiobacillus caldus]OFC36607.1 hypothetical protein BAE27_05940 [Acidithiobacillus caldus]OFC38221.1 hypothetical protein BAE29_09195 [Acidithiobacillus caldus]OFC39321.1 hypothetical protein BAE28_03890 [Acidithiobacillus caldus]OFC50182.1 hypothetical protein BAE30_13010 [Acidithiobacillus caldus]
MFNYKNAALLLSQRISVASHVAVGAVVTYNLVGNTNSDLIAAAATWIVMQAASFVLRAWSDGLPSP